MAIQTCYSYVRRAFTLCALIIALCVYGGQSAKAAATVETVPPAHSVVSHNTEVLSLLDDTSHSWKDVSFIDDTPDLENAEAVLGVFGIFIVGILGFVVYFLPSVVALSRDHEYKIVIIVVNIFCAWTGFVWLGILAWSVWPRRAVSSFSQGGECSMEHAEFFAYATAFSFWRGKQTG